MKLSLGKVCRRKAAVRLPRLDVRLPGQRRKPRDAEALRLHQAYEVAEKHGAIWVQQRRLRRRRSRRSKSMDTTTSAICTTASRPRSNLSSTTSARSSTRRRPTPSSATRSNGCTRCRSSSSRPTTASASSIRGRARDLVFSAHAVGIGNDYEFSGYVTYISPPGKDSFTGRFTARDALKATVRVTRGRGSGALRHRADHLLAHRVGRRVGCRQGRVPRGRAGGRLGAPGAMAARDAPGPGHDRDLVFRVRPDPADEERTRTPAKAAHGTLVGQRLSTKATDPGR